MLENLGQDPCPLAAHALQVEGLRLVSKGELVPGVAHNRDHGWRPSGGLHQVDGDGLGRGLWCRRTLALLRGASAQRLGAGAAAGLAVDVVARGHGHHRTELEDGGGCHQHRRERCLGERAAHGHRGVQQLGGREEGGPEPHRSGPTLGPREAGGTRANSERAECCCGCHRQRCHRQREQVGTIAVVRGGDDVCGLRDWPRAARGTSQENGEQRRHSGVGHGAPHL
mmetsp:Transcript_122271/g.391169  ORF Transcript_122271/g.391169 Transcript_122271/m.391169 type:complete len:226 (-) Transcript_122271:1304-1981(-)